MKLAYLLVVFDPFSSSSSSKKKTNTYLSYNEMHDQEHDETANVGVVVVVVMC